MLFSFRRDSIRSSCRCHECLQTPWNLRSEYWPTHFLIRQSDCLTAATNMKSALHLPCFFFNSSILHLSSFLNLEYFLKVILSFENLHVPMRLELVVSFISRKCDSIVIEERRKNKHGDAEFCANGTPIIENVTAPRSTSATSSGLIYDSWRGVSP